MSEKKTRRQKEILGRLNAAPAMRVGSLAEVLHVTSETIRRDLDDLERQGLLSRTYGGAVLHRPSEPALSERHKALVAERAAIARAAVPLLYGARVIMLGSGATTTQLAHRIAAELTGITAIVHSVSVATALAANPSIRVIMAPGVFHAGESAMHGGQALRFLAGLAADWSVTGASALSPAGPWDALMEAGDIYATMLRQSARHMVVADHSKFDRTASARYAEWTEIDSLVSDRAPRGPLGAALRGAGTALTVTPDPASPAS